MAKRFAEHGSIRVEVLSVILVGAVAPVNTLSGAHQVFSLSG